MQREKETEVNAVLGIRRLSSGNDLAFIRRYLLTEVTILASQVANQTVNTGRCVEEEVLAQISVTRISSRYSLDALKH